MDACTIAKGENIFADQIVAAAGTVTRIWPDAVTAMPFKDQFAKGEPSGGFSRISAVKLAVSGPVQQRNLAKMPALQRHRACLLVQI